MNALGSTAAADTSPAERAVRVFTDHHGSSPEAVWSAPGRVNLIGEHTDYNDGFVLPCALPHRTAVAARGRTDGGFSLGTLDADGHLHTASPSSLDASPPSLDASPAADWTAYPLGVARALSAAGYPNTGADLIIAGDVPHGAGLSSSHALECATALALLDLLGLSPGEPGAPGMDEIAVLVQRAENDYVGAPTGLLDQTASLCCVADHALFYDVRTGTREHVPFAPHANELELLIIDTRVSHSHSESAYGKRRAGCERAAELLGVSALRDVAPASLEDTFAVLPAELGPLVRHVVTENERVHRTVEHLRAGDYAALGPLLNASHESLRTDYQVSCPELDLAVAAAVDAGAVGARMTGGGFGGSALALVPADARTDVERAVTNRFDQHEWRRPRLFTAVPAAGAGKDG
ncbi:galactokinase [Bounagaea algeriensis]